MITKLLVNKFIKNKDNITDDTVRNSYGVLGGAVGISVNIILSFTKLIIGMIVSSIAIIADAFNNLSDALSSIITIVGFKMASKPADEEHPFGHGRIEYISALIVAFLVILVGFQFIQSSIKKIQNPEAITFEIIPFIILIISIILKLWLSKFNKNIGNRINSSALKAASVDALGDVFTSSCVAISFLASKFTNFPIDGYFGLIVALFIIYSGFTLVKDTINPLLGEAPDTELVTNIKEMVLSYDNILGVHDLIVHNYGPGRCMASIHAEIPSDISVMKIHDIIDTAEREISNKLKLHLVIHMDPLCIISEENKKTYDEVNKLIDKNPYLSSIHDFRVIGEDEKKTIIFDVVANLNSKNKSVTNDTLKSDLINQIKSIHPEYNLVITIDNHYL